MGYLLNQSYGAKSNKQGLILKSKNTYRDILSASPNNILSKEFKSTDSKIINSNSMGLSSEKRKHQERFDYNNITSRRELENIYYYKSTKELQHLLNASKNIVDKEDLIKKSNTNKINKNEENLLALELRKQSIIHLILLERVLNDEQET